MVDESTAKGIIDITKQNGHKIENGDGFFNIQVNQKEQYHGSKVTRPDYISTKIIFPY